MLRLLFFLCALCVLCGEDSSANLPNLILIYTDDHGWPDIGAQGIYDDLYHLDACSQAALAFIDRYKRQPFFMYLAYRAPHVPLDAPKKYLDRFPGEMPERRRQALAMISAIDDGIGAITARLKQHNLTNNTLIFFIGDNGAPLKIHQDDTPGGDPGWDGSYNAPLNGEKGMLAEGGMRVPFLTGKEEGPPHEVLTWRWVAQSAIRMDNWKLLCGGSREYLFDLATDPGEKNNLLAANPEIAENLRARLTSSSSELTPPGLEAGAMSTTWEDYYDFYLDKKPASPQRAKFVAEDEPAAIQSIQLLDANGKSLKEWNFAE